MTVRWIGAQRDVLGGDVSGKVALASLAGLPHLYALGPRAGVTGEITVLDGVPWIARVRAGRVAVELMWWNFVARTPEEIAQAREDWEGGRRFGAVHGAGAARIAAPPLVRIARPQ